MESFKITLFLKLRSRFVETVTFCGGEKEDWRVYWGASTVSKYKMQRFSSLMLNFGAWHGICCRNQHDQRRYSDSRELAACETHRMMTARSWICPWNLLQFTSWSSWWNLWLWNPYIWREPFVWFSWWQGWGMGIRCSLSVLVWGKHSNLLLLELFWGSGREVCRCDLLGYKTI